MANVINGSDLMLFINGKSLAFATSHKLSISADTTETSSKDSSGSWTTKKVKKLSWTASTENLYSEDGAGDNFDDLVKSPKPCHPTKAGVQKLIK